jgi:preprotein translocase subunit SecB
MATKQSGTAGSYDQFLQTLKPVVLGLKACEVVLNRTGYWDLFERKKGKPQKHLATEFSLGDVHDDYFDLLAELVVQVRESADAAPPLRIRCLFEAHFHTGVKAAREHAKQFAEAEAKLFIWPYFREFITSTTGRMAIPPLLIPMSFSLPAPKTRRKRPTPAKGQ